MTADLLALLRDLELEVHHPGRCTSRERLEQLLHPDFHEVGRSGKPYDREKTISLLLPPAQALPVACGGFSVELLSAQMALLNFGTALRQPDGSLAHHTLRASLWLREGGQWRLRYHQGTPSSTTWD